MKTDAVLIYFLAAVVTVGVIVALLFRFRYAVSDLESKITGIWANEDNTMRILIYGLESQFQGEVVWTKDIDEKILGSGIIRNLNLRSFKWGEGTYIDPFTKDQFNIRLKLKKAGSLTLQLFEKSGHSLMKVEEWKQVS
jgi:uncharacterized protein (DUF2147 family)